MSHNPDIQALQPTTKFTQQENEALTHTINWEGQLDTDTISTSTWTQETSGGTIANEANTTTQTSGRFSGTPGGYLFTNKITTANGDTLERQVEIYIKTNDRSVINDYRDYGHI